MGMVLLQFAVVLLVVMMGFAMALYPLLQDTDSFTFDAVLLLLFKTLLGDVEAFEEFNDSTQNRYSTVGRLLLVLYLVVMTIMLLNLLIAVLSTKHTKVDVNADKEFKVSRARIIEHYRLAVAFDILPTPLNLPQLVLTLMFLCNGQSAAYTKTREAVGQVSFWLVLGPLFFAAGVLLWVTSSIYCIFQPPESQIVLYRWSEGTASQTLDCIWLFFWRALGAPLCLLALWLRQPFLFIYNGVIPSRIRLGQSKRGDSTRAASASGHKKSDADVQKMLKDAGTGASDLRKYLEDPMCDPKVRSDEVDRGTTVKHMKLLRDRLENKFDERVDHLGKEFNERVDHLGKEFKERIDQLEQKFNERVDHLDKKVGEHVDHLDKKFNERVDSLETNTNALVKKFNERVDSLETNTNALVSETNKKIGLVLESLRGK